MQLDSGTLLTGAIAAVGGVIWLVRLEGRINVSETLIHTMQDDVKEIKEDVKTLLVRHD